MPNDDLEMCLLEIQDPSDLGRVRSKRPSVSINGIPITQFKHSESKTFLKLLLLWIGTIFWTALVAAMVKIYQAKGVITPAQKAVYNFLTLVLILILGLSFFVRAPPRFMNYCH